MNKESKKMKLKSLEESLRLFLTNEELRFFMSFFTNKKEALYAVGNPDSRV